MLQTLKKHWDERPLTLIMVSAIFFRLLAAIFSKGYGMHDDHFLVIEIAQQWVDKCYGWDNWLPFGNSTATGPSGHSLFYPGLQYILFRGLEGVGIVDPQIKMYIVRFLHAAFSLLIVYYGYKITEYYSGKKVARIAGLMLALLWFMPLFSVHNFVEVVCVPFLMYATWMIIQNDEKRKLSVYLLSGMVAGIAFSIRFQSTLFLLGIGLVLLLERKWLGAIAYGFGVALMIALMQGLTDYIIWKQPLGEFMEYVHYNATHPYDYITHGWETYPLLVSGIILPPIGLFLWLGYFRNFRKQLILFLPSFLFFVFHSSFPNKQERFIFPFIPFFIMLGCIGWSEFVANSNYWKNHEKLLRNCWIFFWVLNIAPLIAMSTAYSKRNRVEAMTYLHDKGDARYLIIDDYKNDNIIMPPLFYLRKFQGTAWGVFGITRTHNATELYNRIKDLPHEHQPNYVIFWSDDKLDARVDSLQKYYPKIRFEATIEPRFCG